MTDAAGAGNLLGFASLLLAVVTASLWFRRIFAVRIPQDRTIWVAAFGSAALLGLASFAAGNRAFGAVAAGIGLGVGGFMTGLRAISRQSDKRPAVRVGSPILDFSAPDENGAPFELASLRGRPFLLKFFRGHW